MQAVSIDTCWGFKSLIKQLEESENFLIVKDVKGFGVLANYFYLSIRISKILGFASMLVLIDRKHLNDLLKLVELINKNYSEHFLCMCDSQAPYLYVFFNTLSKLNNTDVGKPLLINYLSDFIESKGMVSRLDVNQKKLLLLCCKNTLSSL